MRQDWLADLLGGISRFRRQDDEGEWEDEEGFLDRMRTTRSGSPDVANFQHEMVERDKEQGRLDLNTVMGGRRKVGDDFKAADAYLMYQNPHNEETWYDYWDDEQGRRHYDRGRIFSPGASQLGDVTTDYWEGRARSLMDSLRYGSAGGGR